MRNSFCYNALLGSNFVKVNVAELREMDPGIRFQSCFYRVTKGDLLEIKPAAVTFLFSHRISLFVRSFIQSNSIYLKHF